MILYCKITFDTCERKTEGKTNVTVRKFFDLKLKTQRGNRRKPIKRTRQHSSRMCTARLPILHVLVVTNRCQYQKGVGPQVKKFEQVSSDDHQMSVAGRRGAVQF